MDEKFILMNLDDNKSKKIAEILGNSTCKKILDYLADNSEASEKDIADALSIPINTAEYNLKKLLDTGLVEKTKNFFWSKKGKKIPMYKLARKHIVISPKSTRPNLIGLRQILPLIAIFAIALLLVLLLAPSKEKIEKEDLKKFNSINDLNNFLKENQINPGMYKDRGMAEDFAFAVGGAKTTSSGAETASMDSSVGANDFSTTNIQVQGVDEADIVKNDDKYIYAVSGNKIFIVNAYPAENMETLSEIELSKNENIQEILINKNKLIIFSNSYDEIMYGGDVRCLAIGCVMPQAEQKTSIYIYDILDKRNPELDDKISVSGNYFDSRMIGDYVYVISNQYVYQGGVLPMIEKNNETGIIEANEIYYSDVQDYNFQYTIILSINIKNAETSDKVLLTGTTQTIFVSQENIYTTYLKSPMWGPVQKTGDGTIQEKEKTIINKFSIDEQNIEYVATGEVPGHVLNQFSMDEYDDNFRIATTLGESWDSNAPSMNNIYVLDGKLELLGGIKDLAPGESIYSVRFLGDRAYIVTFKKIDPLFVIDLSEPENPKVLGKLKIPGYSDYLHPYDENHIIGIGKEAVDASTEPIIGREGMPIIASQNNFAWYQGVKMAIFDVSDVNNPVEMHKVVIGDRGTDSEALQDHKAFLFDKEKELLVMPITLAEIQGEKNSDNQYGEQTFQGAYVYKINLDDGFELLGRISHVTAEEELKSGYYYNWQTRIKRSLFMDNTLYTLSDFKLKANDLADDLKEIKLLQLASPEDYYSYYYGEGVVGVSF